MCSLRPPIYTRALKSREREDPGDLKACGFHVGSTSMLASLTETISGSQHPDQIVPFFGFAPSCPAPRGGGQAEDQCRTNLFKSKRTELESLNLREESWEKDLNLQILRNCLFISVISGAVSVCRRDEKQATKTYKRPCWVQKWALDMQYALYPSPAGLGSKCLKGPRKPCRTGLWFVPSILVAVSDNGGAVWRCQKSLPIFVCQEQLEKAHLQQLKQLGSTWWM